MTVEDKASERGRTSAGSLFFRPTTLELAGHSDGVGPPDLGSAHAVIAFVSGLDHKASAHLQTICEGDKLNRLHLVLSVSPACRTDQNVLRDLLDIQTEADGRHRFFVRPYGDSVTTPTNLLWVVAHPNDTGVVYIGADENVLLSPPNAARLTLGFPLNEGQADRLRQWFDWLVAGSVPLSPAACDIPRLVHPRGTEEGRLLWEAYEAALSVRSQPDVTVDPATGEVERRDEEGRVAPSLAGLGLIKPVDPIRRIVSAALECGAVAVVEKASRVPPLSIPMAATIFERSGRESAGTVSRESRYHVNIIANPKVLKEVENSKARCSTLLRTFSFGLGDNQRWVPNAARPLFERELELEDARGRDALKREIGGDVQQYLEREKGRIIADARQMAAQMGRTLNEGDPALVKVLYEARSRLERAVSGRFAPRYNYASLTPDIGSESEHSSGWSIAAKFLEEAVIQPRQAIFDPYFRRSATLFSEAGGIRQYLTAMNVLNDALVREHLGGRDVSDLAEQEAERVRDMPDGAADRARCEFLLSFVSGRTGAGPQ